MYKLTSGSAIYFSYKTHSIKTLLFFLPSCQLECTNLSSLVSLSRLFFTLTFIIESLMSDYSCCCLKKKELTDQMSASVGKWRERNTAKGLSWPTHDHPLTYKDILLANTQAHILYIHHYSSEQVVQNKWEQSDALMEALSRQKGGEEDGGERCERWKAKCGEERDEVTY